MDLEKLLNIYPNISRDELESMSKFDYFEDRIKMLNDEREKIKIRGREHAVSVPLVQILSVHVNLDKLDENKSRGIYGRIYGEYDHIALGNERTTHNVYNRGPDEPEIINQNCNLTLTGPCFSSYEFDVCMPLHKTTIVVDLWDADRNIVFAQESFLVEEIAENDYEQVKQKVVTGKFGYVVVCYIAMPFATLYQAIIKFRHEKERYNHRVVNVNGKVVIRYDNTYGNYSSEGYTIFEKPNFEFEPLEVNSRRSLRQSRYWIGVPAYSSLVVDWDLWDFDTKRNIFKETVKFPTQPWFGYNHTFKVDDLAIDVCVVNFPVFSREVCEEESDHKSILSREVCEEESDHESVLSREVCEEESDHESVFSREVCDEESDHESVFSREVCEEESDHESAVMCSDDDLLSDISVPWTLRFNDMGLEPSPSVEVFSVFVGHEKCRPLQLFGVIEGSCGPHTFDIFRRQKNNAVELLENENILPILNGNGTFDSSCSLKIMFDLKDVSGLLFIKGYVKWHRDMFDYPWWEQQLCSVIPGEHGFAAVHYSFFPIAVKAKLDVFYKINNSRCNVCPIIYGSLVARYDLYDYSSRYTRDYYRKVLLKRNYEDPLEVPSDMKLPLDRSVVVVPRKANLIIEVDLWSVDLCKYLSHVFEIEIGCHSVNIVKEQFSLDINLEWSDRCQFEME